MTSKAHEKIITDFYEAFGRRDAVAMATLYTDGISFSDPVFPNLQGDKAKNMWKMLCERSKDIQISVRDIHADESRGSAIWEARYTFGKTGRKVHNVIYAKGDQSRDRKSSHSLPRGFISKAKKARELGRSPQGFGDWVSRKT